MPDPPPPIHPQQETPPQPAILLDYHGSGDSSAPRPAGARGLFYLGQYIVDLVSAPVWVVVTLIAASNTGLHSTEAMTIFWVIAAAIYLTLIALAGFKLRWNGLTPGVITGILFTPLIGFGLLLWACADILRGFSGGSGSGR